MSYQGGLCKTPGVGRGRYRSDTTSCPARPCLPICTDGPTSVPGVTYNISTVLHLKLESKLVFLAVHNSSIGEIVTHWVTDWLRTLLIDITEWPWRLVTFETFDQSDDETWPDKNRQRQRQRQWQWQRQRQWQRQIHFESTFKERS